jgi:hypothetical protein
MSFLPHEAAPSAESDGHRIEERRQTSDVGIHVYDLTRGTIAKQLEQLVGESHAMGILHSALVVFGNEYYFEGGISTSRKGRSRFGSQFRYLYVGQTCRSQVEFEAWMRRAEESWYQLADYHPIEHNCHHFTLAACRMLCPELVDEPGATENRGGSNRTHSSPRLPLFLLDNVRSLVETDVGRLLHPVFRTLTGGVQFLVGQHLHSSDRAAAFQSDLLAHACAVSGAAPLGGGGFCPVPRFVAAFLPHASHLSDVESAISSLAALVPPHAAFQPTSREAGDLRALAHSVQAGPSTAAQDEFLASSFVTVCEVVLENTPVHEWAAVLRTARLAAAHRSTLAELLHSAKFLSALLRVTAEAHGAPRRVLEEAVEMLCNVCVAPHGAALLADARCFSSFLRLAGYCLQLPLSCEGGGRDAVTLRDASCALIHNMALAVTLAPAQVAGSTAHSSGGAGGQPMARLATVALYGLGALGAADGELSEVGGYLLLAALVHLASAGRQCQLLFAEHNIRLDYNQLLARFFSEECRALIRLLSAIEDLADPLP